MIYLILFWEFFKVGLFAVGGGLATIPFLYNLSEKFNWFSVSELTNMIAVSESTPGPLGVNMATYAGIQTHGFFGGVTATFGLVLPSLFVIIVISRFLNKFKENQIIKSIFYGLRPAVAVMICIFLVALLSVVLKETQGIYHIIISIILFLCYLGLMFRFKWHPIFFIILGAFMGILLE